MWCTVIDGAAQSCAHLRLLPDEESDWCRAGNDQTEAPVNAEHIGWARIPVKQLQRIGNGLQGLVLSSSFEGGLLLSLAIDRLRS